MSIWGEIIGGTAGFALGGPLGAILGFMVTKGVPQEFIEQANKELSAINLAYDKIKKYRGIN